MDYYRRAGCMYRQVACGEPASDGVVDLTQAW
jgi:hypothetical protein